MKNFRSLLAAVKHALSVDRESGRAEGSSTRVTGCNATVSFETIELFSSYSSGITSIEGHCSRTIEPSSLSAGVSRSQNCSLSIIDDGRTRAIVSYAFYHYGSGSRSRTRSYLFPRILRTIVTRKARLSASNCKFVIIASRMERSGRHGTKSRNVGDGVS